MKKPLLNYRYVDYYFNNDFDSCYNKFMKKYSTIRTIYLYLFALIGLTLIVVGSVNFVNMALKAILFTQADQQDMYYRNEPPMPFVTSKLEDGECLTSEDQEVFDRWVIRYEEWENSSVDPIVAGRQRDAARDLASILIGLPLYIFHWALIRKETV